MRKLFYVGNNGIEVTTLKEKKELEKKGIKFKEVLKDIPKVETEKEREKRLAKIKKREEKRKEKFKKGLTK